MKLFTSYSFVITLIGLLILGAMSLIKGIDVQVSIIGVVGSFVGARAYTKGTAIKEIGQDPNADTVSGVSDLLS
jgi:hypothetical protein